MTTLEWPASVLERFPGLKYSPPKNRHPDSQWRVEWHECGWASRWILKRGWIAPYDVAGDFTNEADANELAALLNRGQQ